MALAIPLIVLFTLVTIDICTIIYLKEAVTIAAYEGSRVGIQRGGTDDLVDFRVRQFLDERNIQYTNPVLIEDPGFDTADELEHVALTVSVPAADNLPFGWFFGGTEITGRVTMRKEFRNP